MTCKMGISINSINNTYGKCVWSHNKVLFIKVYICTYLPTAKYTRYFAKNENAKVKSELAGKLSMTLEHC